MRGDVVEDRRTNELGFRGAGDEEIESKRGFFRGRRSLLRATLKPAFPAASLGKLCKNPKLVTANDFYTTGFDTQGNTTRIKRDVSNIQVLNGTLFVGFVTLDPENAFISKQLNKGDLFAFPQGLVNVAFNAGHTNAVAVVAFNDESPNLVTPKAVFGTYPSMPIEYLSTTYRTDEKVIKILAEKWIKG
ncbi:hypothetical protein Sjap_011880 [Stephania japonica]|uniref:Germin-like protein n=1 Tax=Stephania japonica TaxID=461633 RepID=A0AAP0P5E2_9MAGN